MNNCISTLPLPATEQAGNKVFKQNASGTSLPESETSRSQSTRTHEKYVPEVFYKARRTTSALFLNMSFKTTKYTVC